MSIKLDFRIERSDIYISKPNSGLNKFIKRGIRAFYDELETYNKGK